jgi:hypothetical protein
VRVCWRDAALAAAGVLKLDAVLRQFGGGGMDGLLCI